MVEWDLASKQAGSELEKHSVYSERRLYAMARQQKYKEVIIPYDKRSFDPSV